VQYSCMMGSTGRKSVSAVHGCVQQSWQPCADTPSTHGVCCMSPLTCTHTAVAVGPTFQGSLSCGFFCPPAATYLQGRTDVQCLHRWQKVLNPNLVKGGWTPEVSLGGAVTLWSSQPLGQVFADSLPHGR
jgi:hypothetical protein